MSAPAFDLNKPDPGAAQWGPEVTAIRNNLVNLTMYAAANGGRLPDFDSVLSYTSSVLTQIVLTNKTYTSVKIKITYSYSGSVLDKESLYFDKGLGAGYELLANGVMTYVYTSGVLAGITSANT